MGSLFKKPDIKEPTPVRMPDPEGPDVRAEEERRRRAIAARSGRTSTILSRSSGGEAGTRSYSNSLLGQAS